MSILKHSLPTSISIIVMYNAKSAKARRILVKAPRHGIHPWTFSGFGFIVLFNNPMLQQTDKQVKLIPAIHGD